MCSPSLLGVRFHLYILRVTCENILKMHCSDHRDDLHSCVFQLEEKARLEAEARGRELQQQQLLEAHRRHQEEEEEALKQELLRLKEMQQLHTTSTTANTSTSKKKKRENKAKEAPTATVKPETPSLSPAPTNNPQPLRQSAQNVLENMQNGKTQLLHGLARLKEPVKEPLKELISLPQAKIDPSSPRRGKEKPAEVPPSLPNGTLPHSEPTTARSKSKQQPNNSSRTNGEAGKRPLETPRATEPTSKLAPLHTESKVKARLAEEQLTDTKKEERTNGKKQQNGVKEERNSPVMEPPAAEQNGKVVPAESPQPKSKAKKNKKKKADKMNNSIGKLNADHYLLIIHQLLENTVLLFPLPFLCTTMIRLFTVLWSHLCHTH